MSDVEEEYYKIKKLFLKNSIEDMPCELVSELYNKLSNAYKNSLAGLMGIYLLGLEDGKSQRR